MSDDLHISPKKKKSVKIQDYITWEEARHHYVSHTDLRSIIGQIVGIVLLYSTIGFWALTYYVQSIINQNKYETELRLIEHSVQQCHAIDGLQKQETKQPQESQK